MSFSRASWNEIQRYGFSPLEPPLVSLFGHWNYRLVDTKHVRTTSINSLRLFLTFCLYQEFPKGLPLHLITVVYLFSRGEELLLGLNRPHTLCLPPPASSPIKMAPVVQPPDPHTQDSWSAMAKVVREFDEEKIKGYKEDIDALLVFVSLSN